MSHKESSYQNMAYFVREYCHDMLDCASLDGGMLNYLREKSDLPKVELRRIAQIILDIALNKGWVTIYGKEYKLTHNPPWPVNYDFNIPKEEMKEEMKEDKTYDYSGLSRSKDASVPTGRVLRVTGDLTSGEITTSTVSKGN